MNKSRSVALVLVLITIITGLASCGSEEAEPEEVTLTLNDGTEIELTKVDDEEVGIYGYYVCEADGSKWAFNGENLALGYPDGDSVDCYICELNFYKTVAAEGESSYFLVWIYNSLTESSTYWYLMNILDDETNEIIGLGLINPSEDGASIQLTAAEIPS